MLWALLQPAVLAGLITAFALGLLLRRSVHYLCAAPWRIRSAGYVDRALFNPRRDIDPYGVVASLVCGIGWGASIYLQNRRQRHALWLAPMVVLLCSQLVFVLYRACGLSQMTLRLVIPSDVIRGIPAPAFTQYVLTLGVGLLAFGLLCLVPLPPLDGWALLKQWAQHRGSGLVRATHWLQDMHLGVVILLVASLFSIFDGLPLLLYLLDILATPILHIWA